MKKLVIAFALIFSIGATAQNRREKIKNASSEEKAEMMTNRLTKKLELNDAQTKQVKEILIAQQAENKAMAEKIKAENKIKFNEKQEALKTKLKTVLTADQFKKWETMQAENKEKFKERKNKKN